MNRTYESFQAELAELKKAYERLGYSYAKCQRIGIRPGLSDEELESFEALTSRFARLSDIIIQRIFRYIDTLDLEAQGTVRDRINRAEKRGLIDSADEFIDIRILRNEIAHEYKSETIYAIFDKALELTPILLNSVDRLFSYSKKYKNM